MAGAVTIRIPGKGLVCTGGSYVDQPVQRVITVRLAQAAVDVISDRGDRVSRGVCIVEALQVGSAISCAELGQTSIQIIGHAPR